MSIFAEWTQSFCASRGIAVQQPRVTNVSAQFIVEHVALVRQVSTERIYGRERTKDACSARHLCAYLIRAMVGSSYPAIARVLRRADHTTAMDSVRVVAAAVANDPAAAAEASMLRQLILESWAAYLEASPKSVPTSSRSAPFPQRFS